MYEACLGLTFRQGENVCFFECTFWRAEPLSSGVRVLYLAAAWSSSDAYLHTMYLFLSILYILKTLCHNRKSSNYCLTKSMRGSPTASLCLPSASPRTTPTDVRFCRKTSPKPRVLVKFLASELINKLCMITNYK